MKAGLTRMDHASKQPHHPRETSRLPTNITSAWIRNNLVTKRLLLSHPQFISWLNDFFTKLCISSIKENKIGHLKDKY
jgi:hypothetical protein